MASGASLRTAPSMQHRQNLQSGRSSKSPSTKRSVTPNSGAHSTDGGDEDYGRVRVSVRLRPRNAEDLLADADFADCVELQPELKRLKLRKNNWTADSYRFDEVFTESSSQKRVYEVVAKPVVESVLNGYNGTVMAYGQTGTGKTYTVGNLGKEDPSERGIMVRALEDILTTVQASDSVEVSCLQLYMESVQDLLAPENINIPITEDPKTGEVIVPGATVVKIRHLDHFVELLQTGEANRHAANTKMNTESSRSHAILMVYVQRSIERKHEDQTNTRDRVDTKSTSSNNVPIIRRSKLLIVDLAGSERIDKSGCKGHALEEAKFINLSLTSLGKCINALAENSPHIPTRDSKLTRLLRDSFGGSARTSLIVTIGPSSRHHAETTSTILFGQRAMKIVNMLKLKEEFDYESLCRNLQNQIDHLTAEVERQERLRDNDKRTLEKHLKEHQDSFSSTKNDLIKRFEFLQNENNRLQLENKELSADLSYQKEQNDILSRKITQMNYSQDEKQHETTTYKNVLADTTQMYEKKIAELIKQLEGERDRAANAEDQLLSANKLLYDHQLSLQQHEKEQWSYEKVLLQTKEGFEKKIRELTIQLEDEHARFEDIREQLDSANKLLNDKRSGTPQGQEKVDKLGEKLNDMYRLHDDTLEELQFVKADHEDFLDQKTKLHEELKTVRRKLLDEEKQRKNMENELAKAKKIIAENLTEDKRFTPKENIGKGSSSPASTGAHHKPNPLRETQSSQRTTIAKICEEVGLAKILALLSSEDVDVQIHAVKVVANLAAEDNQQERIVEEGGLDALLMLLRSSENTTVLRVASGAIANLAMNEPNQGLIMSKQGAQLLAKTATKTDDPQTLRMVAGGIANLCGNEKLHQMLKEGGGIKALLEMAKSGNADVIAQVARGIANFAKCESRAILQGQRKGRSLLMEDGVLLWLISNSNSSSTASIRRHIELALCHLAQNEDNARDLISSGGVKELRKISNESSREDIRNLAKKTLRQVPIYQTDELKQLSR